MRKDAHHEEHVDESWLIPYADLLTLLLALFIVLFASSTVDQEKYGAMMEAIHAEFGGELPKASGAPGLGPGNGPGNGPGGGPPGAPLSGGGQNPSDGQMHGLAQSFLDYIKRQQLSTQMAVYRMGDGLMITLTSDIWFPSGEASINEEHRRIAKELGAMIEGSQQAGQQLRVVISGHTDNMPINNSSFSSNWQLSVARAVNFMEALLATTDLDPSRFSARGLGEYEPIDTNDTKEGRAHNRRVEVFIEPDVEHVEVTASPAAKPAAADLPGG